jgi:hypothetical protein
MNLTDSPLTDPTPTLRYRDCLYGDDMLVTAVVWIDFFTWLKAHGPATGQEICAHYDFQSRPVDVMLTMFRARNLLDESGGKFSLTASTAEYLCSDSPWSIIPYYASLKDRPVAKDLLQVLKTGKTANWGSQQEKADWHKSMETEEFATQFTSAMDCRGVLLAGALAKKLDFSSHHHLLDIAGGSAVYACSLVAHHPHLKATVLEKSPVDKIAAGAIAKRGFSDRVNVHSSDMLTEPLPAGPDIHLFSNVLHDWDIAEVKQLLQASYQALPAGGMLVVHDAFLLPDKSGPLHVAEYSVMLMHATQGRCYSSAEIEKWAGELGFHTFHYQDTAASRGVLTALK